MTYIPEEHNGTSATVRSVLIYSLIVLIVGAALAFGYFWANKFLVVEEETDFQQPTELTQEEREQMLRGLEGDPTNQKTEAEIDAYIEQNLPEPERTVTEEERVKILNSLKK